MFGIIKVSIVLLTNIVNASNHTQCVSLSIQKWQIQQTLINLHPNEYSQEYTTIHLLFKLDKCFEICNILHAFLIKYVFQIKQKI